MIKHCGAYGGEGVFPIFLQLSYESTPGIIMDGPVHIDLLEFLEVPVGLEEE